MIYISFIGYLAFVVIVSLFSASTLFLIKKNGWHDRYQYRRKRWMPNWCSPCSTLWIAILPCVALAIFFEEPFLAIAPLMVPPLAHSIYRAMAD